jgi:hypothetical protein
VPAKPKCEWNNNHLACVNTWAFLRGLGELRPSFSNSGDLTMAELKYWNPAAPASQRKLEATALAARLDRIYIKALLAKYESGFNFAKATTELASALTSPDKTLCELSQTIDVIYNFKGEVR